jgi:hypothetical protein
MNKKTKSIKAEVKRMGYNAKYHAFPGEKRDVLKFYTSNPNDEQIGLLNAYMASEFICGVAKRVHTDRHPLGFLEISIYK